MLGSATPSLESYYNAQNGRYALSTLEKRVLDRPLADVRVVDMREEYAAAGPDVILSSRSLRIADGAPRRRGAGDRAAEPPRIRHVGRVPAVRFDARVPELQPVR